MGAGNCACTTSTSANCTTKNPPDAWGPWGACSGGFQIRFCSTNGADSQVQACSVTPPPVPTSPPAPTASPIPACAVTTSPASLNLVLGGTAGIVTASVTSGLGSATVTSMAFGSYDTSKVTVSPTSDISNPYSTNVTAVALGSASVWATATLSDGRLCPAAGVADTDITVSAPTCTITLSPATTNLTLSGIDGTITATPVCTAPVDNVSFSTSNAGVVSIVSVSPDTTSPYTVTVHGVATGGVIITGTVNIGGVAIQSGTAVVNAAPLNAWFQVKDGDVYSGNDLTTNVTLPQVFELPGTGTFPGIPSYQVTTDLNNAKTSALGWLANNTATNQKVLDYQALANQTPIHYNY